MRPGDQLTDDQVREIARLARTTPDRVRALYGVTNVGQLGAALEAKKPDDDDEEDGEGGEDEGRARDAKDHYEEKRQRKENERQRRKEKEQRKKDKKRAKRDEKERIEKERREREKRDKEKELRASPRNANDGAGLFHHRASCRVLDCSCKAEALRGIGINRNRPLSADEWRRFNHYFRS